MGHGRVQLNHPLVVDGSTLFVPLVRSGMWPTIKFHSPGHGDTLTPQANHKTSVMDTLRTMRDALAAANRDIPDWLALVVQEKDEDPKTSPSPGELAPEYRPLPLTPLQAAKLSKDGAAGEKYLAPSQQRLLADVRKALEAGRDLSDLTIDEHRLAEITTRATALRDRLRTVEKGRAPENDGPAPR